MKQKSWLCTLITQLSLCVLAYIAINIGQPQKLPTPNDFYFLSVAGGFRPFERQALLLQQMVKVERTYKARFVVDFSELGETDPLLQNATEFPDLQNMPWYTAGASDGYGETFFAKKIETSYGQTLDIIALDTIILQDQSSPRANDQIVWLKRTLNESNSDWKIVFGIHALIPWDYSIRKTKETPFEHLHKIFLQYGVDAYISKKTSGSNIQGVPHLTAINHNSKSKDEIVDGFLLHRVSSLEMVTLVVKLTGEIEHRLSFQQKGRAAM